MRSADDTRSFTFLVPLLPPARKYLYHRSLKTRDTLLANPVTYSGILAFGFMQMDGVAGLSGWRWIFIMEGTS